jgi:azurin
MLAVGATPRTAVLVKSRVAVAALAAAPVVAAMAKAIAIVVFDDMVFTPKNLRYSASADHARMNMALHTATRLGSTLP